MNEQDKLLLFLPVSTSVAITKTSGRGIGTFSVLEDLNKLVDRLKSSQY